MSLPTDLLLPLPQDYKSDLNPDRYLNDLAFSIQSMYEQLAQVTNGTYRNYADIDSSQWVPTLNGITPGTFTYSSQYGWVLRQGLMNDIWGDVTWTATTASGGLYVDLPYLVTKSNGMPFIGECQSSGITYTTGSYLAIHAIPNTYRGEIWCSGTGATLTRQSVRPSGRIIFHVRYIGVSEE